MTQVTKHFLGEFLFEGCRNVKRLSPPQRPDEHVASFSDTQIPVEMMLVGDLNAQPLFVVRTWRAGIS
jgi:hypothetical protein